MAEKYYEAKLQEYSKRWGISKLTLDGQAQAKEKTVQDWINDNEKQKLLNQKLALGGKDGKTLTRLLYDVRY